MDVEVWEDFFLFHSGEAYWTRDESVVCYPMSIYCLFESIDSHTGWLLNDGLLLFFLTIFYRFHWRTHLRSGWLAL